MTGSRHRVILDGGHDSTPNIKLNLPSERAATLQQFRLPTGAGTSSVPTGSSVSKSSAKKQGA